MLSKVYVNLKGVKTEDYINPENFLYAHDHPTNRDYTPCIKLFPLKTVLTESDLGKLNEEERQQYPKKLNMTLLELGQVDGFIYVMVKSLVNGETHPIVLSKSAIISTRPYHRKNNDEQMYIIYVVGYDRPMVTLHTCDNIGVLLSE